MNLAFLGDALDHWKGSLFESLQQSAVLRDFAVDAMASDWTAWQPEDLALFARLLRVQPAQVIRHTVGLSSRSQYFSEIVHGGDLFLDPDTGVATGTVKSIHQYIKPSEIAGLLLPLDRMLAIYQHIRAQSVSARVDAVCRTLNCAIGSCHWTSYESGTVAMIFLSRSQPRTAAVAEHFGAVLGRHALGRVRTSNHRGEHR